MSHDTLAALVSGGLDSAILLGDTLRRQPVVPIYVRFGLNWESVEYSHLERYLTALACPALKPLVTLDEPIADVYGSHWSVTGQGVPLIGTADEAVFLPGRNVLLLAKSMLWCHLHGVSAIALGSLQTNPFPDATPEFFCGFQEIVNRAVGGKVEVRLPFGGMKKAAVMAVGNGLPLEHTFSCVSPRNALHCGRCNKCGERRDAFADAGTADPTVYSA
jgi:7-cyano-7-deazaguanine synthase